MGDIDEGVSESFEIAPASFDLGALPDAFYANPFPTYRLLRNQAPVLELPSGGFFLTRYADLNTVYRDPRRFSSDKKVQFAPVFGTASPLFEHHTTSLVFNDPPLHSNVRRAIGNTLSMRIVRSMRGDVEILVDRLLDRVADSRSFDLVEDYAAAIPVEVIGNLLGVPADEREPLRRWSLDILGSLEVGVEPADLCAGNSSVTNFLELLDDLVKRRRATETGDDILGRLMRWQANGSTLSPAELYHQCIFLLNAGHETTTNLIANGVELLLRFPDACRQLKAEPGLIDTAIEEFLRFESSNQLGNRTTTEDVLIGGVPIPAGTVLTLCIGAANRDPDVFEIPERLVLDRAPNPHLAFGAGIHTCAGLNVARLEASIAIAQLIERFPNLAPAGEFKRAKRARFRGFDRLPLSV